MVKSSTLAVTAGTQPLAEGSKPLRKATAALNNLALTDTVAPADGTFPIVGVGASAGGLEALELFLAHVPPACGLAFVIVQHLDPTCKGFLVELLQRVTAMPVMQITDRMKVKADHVYVIAPNTDLSILHGVLHLLEPVAPRGLRLPIDYFFRSLAADQQERAIGVILSGMGSDGTLGLRDIKECAGSVFVQDPPTAKFDSMPRSAIAAGLADVVAAAEVLPGKIMTYLQHTPLLLERSEIDRIDSDQSGLEKVVLLLRTQTGQDFSLYKKSTLYRRIERRMGLHQLNNLTEYVRYLRETPQEGALLFKELLIGVTSFFRDPEVWEQLKMEVIPALLAANPEGGALRAWTTACSTGEEAYSLAIVFREALEQAQAGKPIAARHTLQIFATDLDTDAIARARNAIYPANIAADVSEQRLRSFFVQEERGYRVSKEIREMVVFAPQNLVMDPPFSKLDLVTCRNLLIYLEADLQKKLLPLFHYSLKPGGILLLGTSETIGHADDLFAPLLPGKNRIYRRLGNSLRTGEVEFPIAPRASRASRDIFVSHGAERVDASLAPLASHAAQTAQQVQAQTDALLQNYAPAAVLTNDQGDIVYISGRIGKYLEPAAGHANLSIFTMAREGLVGPLYPAFSKALRQTEAITLERIKVISNAGTQHVAVTIQYLRRPIALKGMVLIVFTDLPVVKASAKSALARAGAGTAPDAELDELRQELQRYCAEVQVTREEMQTFQEELKSTNEELQSTNEELQSANEELTTSREEMQSLNEELQTVNYELNAKVEDLSLASDDMTNLLNSTAIATLFLDGKLKVRRFTTQTTQIIRLIPADAGRPITDLVSDLDYPRMADDAHQVLRTLIFCERQVVSHDGRWFAVRILPYLTQTKRIDGVVITFVDISVTKALEATLREALEVLQGRYGEQASELDEAKLLENVLNKARTLLEQRFSAQTSELKQSRADLKTEKELRE
ncbi:chemotaxis protein CheB [Pseudomonas sp. TMP9]|uniref:chemotaxis protein CheB n=1 Tax=Pseudomonas sp. TMP9 TaxID=3133144 RepID=UPI0030CCE0DE